MKNLNSAIYDKRNTFNHTGFDRKKYGNSDDGFMVFNATFNNISVILRQSGLLVEETGVPAENHRPVAIKSLTNFIT
jgi:hypothetical protein